MGPGGMFPRENLKLKFSQMATVEMDLKLPKVKLIFNSYKNNE